MLEVGLDQGKATNVTKGVALSFSSLTSAMTKILAEGRLISSFVKKYGDIPVGRNLVVTAHKLVLIAEFASLLRNRWSSKKWLAK